MFAGAPIGCWRTVVEMGAFLVHSRQLEKRKSVKCSETGEYMLQSSQ
jgi:hypothetical protein